MTSDRTKVGLENMNAMKDSASKKGYYTDIAFPRNLSAIYWKDSDKPDADDIPKPEVQAAMKFTRLSDDPNLKGAKLFGEKGIRPVDINQGGLGDCWFLAAAAAISEHKGAMEKVFETDLNVKGGYAVNLYALGVPQTTVVDDYIPYYDGKHIFAGVSNDNSLWPMILEKAFAKM